MSNRIDFIFDTSGQIPGRLIVDYQTSVTADPQSQVRMDQQVAFSVQPVIVNPPDSQTLYSPDFLNTDQIQVAMGNSDEPPTSGAFTLGLLAGTIASVSTGGSYPIQTSAANSLANGNTVKIIGSTTTPSIDGQYPITVVDLTHFNITGSPVVTVSGAGGSIYLVNGTTGSNLTGLPFNEPAATLQPIFTAAAAQLTYPGAIVQLLETGVYKFIGATNGAIPTGFLVADPTALDPSCGYVVVEKSLGSSSSPYILLLAIKQTPMVFAQPATLLPATGVAVNSVQAGSATQDQIQSVDFTVPNTYGGTFSATAVIPDVANAKTISAISIANPAQVTTTTEHWYTSGNTIIVSGSNSTPPIDGSRVVTVVDATNYTVAVNVTGAGTSGTSIKQVSATCGIATPNMSASEFGTLLSNHPLIFFASSTGTANNVAVSKNGQSFIVHFTGTLGLSASPSLSVSNIDLIAPQGVSGLLYLNTEELYEYSLGQPGQTFQILLSIKRLRASGEIRTIFPPVSITINKDIFSAGSVIPVALPSFVTVNSSNALTNPTASAFYAANPPIFSAAQFENLDLSGMPIANPGDGKPWLNGGVLQVGA